jgi:hypothetical protein
MISGQWFRPHPAHLDSRRRKGMSMPHIMRIRSVHTSGPAEGGGGHIWCRATRTALCRGATPVMIWAASSAGASMLQCAALVCQPCLVTIDAIYDISGCTQALGANMPATPVGWQAVIGTNARARQRAVPPTCACWVASEPVEPSDDHAHVISIHLVMQG